MSDPKAALRREMKIERAVLAVNQPDAGERLAEAFVARDAWPDTGALVAGFHPMQSEIDPRPLMMRFHRRGHGLALPALFESAEGLKMVFRAYDPLLPLVEGPYGIWQPSPDAAEVFPDIVLVPLLAFDRQGGRLGYGGGFYDRALHYLKAVKPVKDGGLRLWGVAFSAQETESVPTEPHDQRLDAVLTEQGLIEIL